MVQNNRPQDVFSSKDIEKAMYIRDAPSHRNDVNANEVIEVARKQVSSASELIPVHLFIASSTKRDVLADSNARYTDLLTRSSKIQAQTQNPNHRA